MQSYQLLLLILNLLLIVSLQYSCSNIIFLHYLSNLQFTQVMKVSISIENLYQFIINSIQLHLFHLLFFIRYSTMNLSTSFPRQFIPTFTKFSIVNLWSLNSRSFIENPSYLYFYIFSLASQRSLYQTIVSIHAEVNISEKFSYASPLLEVVSRNFVEIVSNLSSSFSFKDESQYHYQSFSSSVFLVVILTLILGLLRTMQLHSIHSYSALAF